MEEKEGKVYNYKGELVGVTYKNVTSPTIFIPYE